MKQLLAVTALVLFVKTVTSQDALDFLSDEFINFINSNQTLWRAGRNFRRDTPLAFINTLAGTIKDNITTNGDDVLDDLLTNFTKSDAGLPENFDARLKWTNCHILNDIRDQGACGSCWAVSAVAAMTDRVCIASNGKTNFYFSAKDALSCCFICGSGCGGGILKRAWIFCKNRGIVSGGGYGSNKGCLPYPFPPCDHRIAPDQLEPCVDKSRTPVCNKTCDLYYGRGYDADKKKCTRVYEVKTDDVLNEIYTNGPVTTSYEVYADFLHYKSGVYRHVGGKAIGGHSVKVIGWGVEKGTKYWLVANSWNEEWGDKGFFKIVRGENHCGIEDQFIAGIL